ncbi:MAG: FlgO family outer membrane protein [Acidovorax sp.]
MMKHMHRRATLLLAGSLALTGCAQYYYGESAGAGFGLAGSLVDASQQAADALLQNAPLNPNQPVLVGTLVSVDRLDESSRFGRTVSEQIAARLTQRGLRVTEVRLRENMAMQPGQGELLLSRELRNVGRAHDAQAVVTGTYAVSANQVFVNLKLVRAPGSDVLAAHSYVLPIDNNVRALLMGR